MGDSDTEGGKDWTMSCAEAVSEKYSHPPVDPRARFRVIHNYPQPTPSPEESHSARNAGHVVHHDIDHNRNRITVGRGRKPGLGPPAAARGRSAARVHERHAASRVSATVARAGVTKVEEASLAIKEVVRRCQDVLVPVHPERSFSCSLPFTSISPPLPPRPASATFAPSLFSSCSYHYWPALSPPAATLAEYQDYEDISNLGIIEAEVFTCSRRTAPLFRVPLGRTHPAPTPALHILRPRARPARVLHPRRLAIFAAHLPLANSSERPSPPSHPPESRCARGRNFLRQRRRVICEEAGPGRCPRELDLEMSTSDLQEGRHWQRTPNSTSTLNPAVARDGTCAPLPLRPLRFPRGLHSRGCPFSTPRPSFHLVRPEDESAGGAGRVDITFAAATATARLQRRPRHQPRSSGGKAGDGRWGGVASSRLPPLRRDGLVQIHEAKMQEYGLEHDLARWAPLH
ncbi:hypothetical protein B0H13DRAFT_1850131 [Mycena leptocephala]|nr:hypothetical protein B0H13DRAFT_1850131 [Mycena leptocephala]